MMAGSTFYVSPNGNDSSPGDIDHRSNNSTSSGRQSQQRKSGDTVIVGQGAYRPNSANYVMRLFQMGVSGTLEAPITIQAYSGDNTNYSGPAILKGSVWRIQIYGFRFPLMKWQAWVFPPGQTFGKSKTGFADQRGHRETDP